MKSLSLSAAMALPLLIAIAASVAAPAGDIQLPPETVQLQGSSLPGYALAQQKCQICHSADYISYQPPNMTLTQWTAEVVKMQHSYGAPIADEEVKPLAEYLTSAYGDAKSLSPAGD